MTPVLALVMRPGYDWMWGTMEEEEVLTWQGIKSCTLGMLSLRFLGDTLPGRGSTRPRGVSLEARRALWPGF